MLTVSTREPSTHAPMTKVRTAVTAAGLVGAMASGAYISGVILLHDLPTNEALSAPLSITACLLAGLAFVALAVNLAGLAEGTRLPRWALSIAAAGCAFIAIQAWAYGTFVADLATKIGNTQFERLADETLLLQLMYVPMGAVCLAGFVTVAVTGWRRRAMSRGACVLLALSGVAAMLGPFPPAGLLSGAALAWTARTVRQVHNPATSTTP